MRPPRPLRSRQAATRAASRCGIGRNAHDDVARALRQAASSASQPPSMTRTGRCGIALGQLARQLVRALRGAVPEPQFRAREPGRDRLRQLTGADQQRRAARAALVAQQAAHLRAVGGAAQIAQVLRADRLGILEQQLHPGRELPRERRAALGELAPGLLDLAEDLGLGDQLALQPAGKAQQERIGLVAFEALERAIGRKFLPAPALAASALDDHRHAALAGVDQETSPGPRELGRRGAGDMCAAPMQDVEIT